MMNPYPLLPGRRPSTRWQLVCVMLLAALPLVAQPTLVKDINKSVRPVQSVGYGELKAASGLLYFAFDDGVHGEELWKSNGTAAGTVLLKDIFPGTAGASPGGFTEVNGVVYFRAGDGKHGVELWKTDGTAAGTVLVKDINPGPADAEPLSLVNLNGVAYFGANDGVNGRELWKSNGTAAGTVLVKDINPGAASASPLYLENRNGMLVFAALTPDTGVELWKSNGTAAGTVLLKDIRPGPTGSAPNALKAVGNTVYFAANDGTYGEELWKTDGTAAGTVLVKDIEEGHYQGWQTGYVYDSSPRSFTEMNGKVYFSAFHADYGYELWKTDGTAAGTVLVDDTNPKGYDDSERIGFGEFIYFFIAFHGNPYHLTNANGTLYFAGETGFYNTTRSLYRSNGTGATPVRQMEAISGIAALGATTYVTNLDPYGTMNLWKTDGTEAGTTWITRVGKAVTQSAYPQQLTKSGNLLYFAATDTLIDFSSRGTELWKSDGTEAGTTMVKDITPGPEPTYPSRMTDVNGTLYFVAKGRLWKTTGTAASTVIVAYWDAENLFNVNGTLYFTRRLGDFSSPASELWKTNGTAAGTVKLSNDALSAPHFTVLNGVLYFAGAGGLWKTNGTVAGTVPVKSGVAVAELTAVNGTLYFRGTAASGAELWKSNGTAGGTVLVKDILPGPISGHPQDFTNANGKLFFVATNGVHGAELWKTDGTAAGTVMVRDIHPGVSSSLISNPSVPGERNVMRNVNGTLFFAADDGVHGVELWKSDGTAAGTVLVKDLAAGPAAALNRYNDDRDPQTSFLAVNGALYFSTFVPFPHPDEGPALWRTDGTAAGTQRVLRFGGYPSIYRFQELTLVNGTLFFRADDNQHGTELWKFDVGGCLQTVASLAVQGSSVCVGSNGTVTVKATQAGVTYRLWLGPSAVGQPVKSPGGDITLTIPAVSLAPGTHTFSVRAVGCAEVSLAQAATVTVSAPLTAPTAAGKTISGGQTATLTAGGAPAGAVYRWYPAASGGTLLATGSSFTTPALPATTTYYVAAFLAPCGESPRRPVPVTVTAAGTFRVNAGGNAFSTIDQRGFSADAYFSGGAVSTATAAGIGGTADDYLYQTGRHGTSFTYNFPTGNGAYDVVLHFAETYFGNTAPGGVGSRKFHVNLEGQRKLTDYDVYAKAGGALKATQETFRVTVGDGTLNVSFLRGTADNPAIKAIEVLPAGSALAINAGGGAFTTGGGKRFSADVYYADGVVSSIPGGEIANTTDDALYRNARFGVFSYGLPSGNGTFDVTLHFAETYFGSRAAGGVGSRKFNVYVEGAKRLSDYDVFAKAGGAMRAVRETVRVTVTDGVLNLYFARGSADNPLVSALEVVPVTAAAREAALEAGAEDWPVTLFPNPVRDRLSVTLPFPAGQVEATAVTDAKGTPLLRDAHRQTGAQALEIRTEGLPAGLYLLHLDGPQGSRRVKFIKQ